MEGINHEAVGLAGHLKLGRLIVLWDDNQITIDGSTDLSRSEDVVARHRGGRLAHDECDGLDADDVTAAIEEAIADPRPTLIRCKTIIGYGAPNKRGTAATHGARARQGRGAAARELGWASSRRISPCPTTCSPPGAQPARGAPRPALWTNRGPMRRKDGDLHRAARHDR